MSGGALAQAIRSRRERVLADPLRVKCEDAWWSERTRYGGEAPSFTDWANVWYGTCFGCGLTPAMGVDHILPLKRGGRNVLPNLQPSCRSCNSRKRDRAPSISVELRLGTRLSRKRARLVSKRRSCWRPSW